MFRLLCLKFSLSFKNKNKNKNLLCGHEPFWSSFSLSLKPHFSLLQPTPSLSCSHMRLLKILPEKPCDFMPFSSAQAILRLSSVKLCWLTWVPLTVLTVLLQLFIYFLKKFHPRSFLTWAYRWKGFPWIRYNLRNKRLDYFFSKVEESLGELAARLKQKCED